MGWRRRDLKGNEALRALELKSEIVLRTWQRTDILRATPRQGTLNYQIWKLLADSPTPMGPSAIAEQVGISVYCVAEHLKQMSRRGLTKNLMPGRGRWIALHREDIIKVSTRSCLRPRPRSEVAAIMGCSGQTIWKRIWWLKENYPMRHEWTKPNWNGRPQREMVNSTSEYGVIPARRVCDINIQPPGYVPPPVKEIEFKIDPVKVWEAELANARMAKTILEWDSPVVPLAPENPAAGLGDADRGNPEPSSHGMGENESPPHQNG
jgi:hypothetical protein